MLEAQVQAVMMFLSATSNAYRKQGPARSKSCQDCRQNLVALFPTQMVDQNLWRLVKSCLPGCLLKIFMQSAHVCMYVCLLLEECLLNTFCLGSYCYVVEMRLAA